MSDAKPGNGKEYRAEVRRVAGKSADHAIVTSYVETQSLATTARRFRSLAFAALGGATYLLYRNEQSHLDDIALIGGAIQGTFFAMQEGMAAILRKQVTLLGKTHNARLRMILSEIKNNIDDLALAVEKVEREFFPKKTE